MDKEATNIKSIYFSDFINNYNFDMSNQPNMRYIYNVHVNDTLVISSTGQYFSGAYKNIITTKSHICPIMDSVMYDNQPTLTQVFLIFLLAGHFSQITIVSNYKQKVDIMCKR